ncbi:hydroxymethylglutaryl-CoA lyase [Pseudoprimorskyibacter insulae]|uniref:Hydroxymethylglutaryl-CoA lyase YngG n=1 Tax=Pseudoprimorskyibacter insulae TaxID=1695997 RepID=A0A2R8B0J8_9RHOB|nr:hydroxymethylglutaryl-CoA lyase [Pseudoprimorskyibacter insulae]SPF81737.1 Hydroxymethylglutaryl-CoA lyase YngG [Pseudoprimorskyibacter insulae]
MSVDLNKAYPAGQIAIREVGLRDGLQLTKVWPDTAQKRAWVAQEAAAGMRYFEVGSFLPADKVPRFADVRDVIDEVAAQGAHGVALALNQRGATDALATGVDEITVVISASAAHNEANVRRTQDQSLSEMAAVAQLRADSGKSTILNAGIAMAFGCSLSGDVAEDDVMRIVDRCLEAGVDMVGLADSVGYGGPKQVARLARRMEERLNGDPWVLHLHDTRGLGLANAAAALDAGCRVFDASLAGLGGCPFAPGATGNVVTEDLVFLAETMGFDTGIDLPRLIETRALLNQALAGEALHGALAKAGTPNLQRWL